MESHRLREISEKALAQFADRTVERPKAEGDHYIRRRGDVLQWRRGLQLTKVAEQQDIHNLLFPAAIPGPLDFHIPPPCFAILVGRYGVGKTETIRRMGDECYARALQKMAGLEEGRSERIVGLPGPFWPIPINLARCRGEQKLLDRIPSASEFIEFLRGDGQLEAEEWNAVRKGLIRGEVCLLLDGLDEALDQYHRHVHFFFALSAFLRSVRGLTVLGVRKEYLAAIDPECREVLRPFGRGEERIMPVFTVELGSFADQEVQSYLERRLGPDGAKPIWRALNERVNAELKTMLYRPLHLRVFVDLAQAGNVSANFLDSLKSNPGARSSRNEGIAALFRRYTEAAFEHARALQRSINATWIWDNDRLSDVTMDLYSKKKDVLKEKQILEIRVGLEGPEGAPDESPMLSIHKCPFLFRDITEKQARFTQRAFYEYFSVRGIVRDLEKKAWDVERAYAFNNLVVNADMRKYLRGMVNNFDGKIEFSCGLHNPEYWRFQEGEFETRREWLRDILVKVTWGMTNPEESDPEIERAIRALLHTNLNGFDPGYLRYVLHAVLTYMVYENRRFDRGWKGAWQVLMETLEQQLRASLASLERGGEDQEPGDEEPEHRRVTRNRHQFLIEEIVNACVTVNLDWVETHIDDLSKALEDDWERGSKTRMMSHMNDLARRK